MLLAIYTVIHVLISLVGIGSGFAVFYGLLAGRRMEGLTTLFLTTTVLTSLTGYGFPVHQLMPSHIVGAISLVVLVIAIMARRALRQTGRRRSTFIVTSAIAQYLNVFVLIIQSFEKVPALKAAAPTQSEPPFVVVQVAVLAFFIVMTILAVRRFRPEPAHAV